jgi:hypothetical protein
MFVLSWATQYYNQCGNKSFSSIEEMDDYILKNNWIKHHTKFKVCDENAAVSQMVEI